MATAGLRLIGQWKKAKAIIVSTPSKIDRATDMAVAAIAEYLVGQIKRKIGSNVPPPNALTTAMLKRSSKTLINKGDMRNGVRAIKTDEHQYFVGIPASAQGKGGQLVRLARVHEEGMTIVMRMTDKQRRFLHARLAKLPSSGGRSSGILVIHIPARPFIAPVYAEFQPKAGAMFEKLVSRNLGIE